jgi:chromosome segregation ATPase
MTALETARKTVATLEERLARLQVQRAEIGPQLREVDERLAAEGVADARFDELIDRKTRLRVKAETLNEQIGKISAQLEPERETLATLERRAAESAALEFRQTAIAKTAKLVEIVDRVLRDKGLPLAQEIADAWTKAAEAEFRSGKLGSHHRHANPKLVLADAALGAATMIAKA